MLQRVIDARKADMTAGILKQKAKNEMDVLDRLLDDSQEQVIA